MFSRKIQIHILISFLSMVDNFKHSDWQYRFSLSFPKGCVFDFILLKCYMISQIYQPNTTAVYCRQLFEKSDPWLIIGFHFSKKKCLRFYIFNVYCNFSNPQV